MLKTFYELGKYICEKEKNDPLTLSLREQFQDKGLTKEITIQLIDTNGQIVFNKINGPIEIDIENSGKYGVLGTSSNGANLILFFIFAGKTAKKMHINRKKSLGIEIENIIVGFEDNFINFSGLDDKIRKCLEENQDKIKKLLLDLEYSQEEKYLLTISINDKYPNEINQFQKQLIDAEKEKNYNKNNANSIKEEGKCTICLKEQVTLVGTLNLNKNFSYFTFLEKTYTRNFNNKNAYKNTGICKDCASFINFASHYINNHFVFNDKLKSIKKGGKYISNEYYVIPVLTENNTMIFDDFNKLMELTKRITNEDSRTISSKNRKFLDVNEDYLSSIIAEFDDRIQFNYIFYSKDNAKREIKKSIKEVLPSSMRKILSIHQEIEAQYQNYLKNNNRFFYSLSILWEMITHKNINPAEKPKSFHYIEYLNYLAAIFSNNEKISFKLFQKISVAYLIELIQHYDNIKYAYFKVLDLFYLYLFLDKLEIYYDKEGFKMDIKKIREQFENENSSGKYVNEYWNQFESYPEFFNTPEKCFAFLMGKLTAETRYVRQDKNTKKFKGSFIDGWLSNFSTNIYKLSQLMERCIETLSIEDKLMVKQRNILAITTYFSKLVSQNNLIEKTEELVFPFVSGFCFYKKTENMKSDNNMEVKENE